MGVPVLTKKGNNFVSRCGESININIGMNDFIAKDDDDYLRKAIELSQDREKLSSIRKTLREKARISPLFDSESFGNDFSNMMKEIWSNYISKNSN